MKIFFSALAFTIFSAAAFAASEKPQPDALKIRVEKDWLLLPMKGVENYSKTEIFDASGNLLFSAPALLTSGSPDWRAPVNVSAQKGSDIFLAGAKGAPSVFQTDNPPWTKPFTDRARPLFHLTAKEGYMGSLCGVLHFGGKWNALFLNNPYSMNPRAPYFAARAVGDDLTRWSYEPPLYMPQFAGGKFLYPLGGSCDIDPATKAAVLAWRFSDGSLSIGKSANLKSAEFFSKIESLAGGEAAPDIFFDKEKKLWILSIGSDSALKFFASANLKDWRECGKFDVDFDAPSLAKTHIAGGDGSLKYVVLNGDGRYLVADFDGEKFSQISPAPLRIFFGDIFGVRFLRGVPDGRLLAAAVVSQPPDLLRDVGQSFVNSMSMPFEMRLADASVGLRLRASLLREISEYFGDATDALGMPSMNFRSNIFTLPDATGNYFALAFTFNTDYLDAFVLGAGISRFGYNRKFGTFYFRRVETIRNIQKLSDPLPSGYLNVLVLLDSYSYEALFLNGAAVVFIGDSFINPEQQIKIGAKGGMYVDKVSRIPILSTTQKQRGEIAKRRLDALERERLANEQRAAQPSLQPALQAPAQTEAQSATPASPAKKIKKFLPSKK